MPFILGSSIFLPEWAESFSLANLARLTELAHQNGAKVYVAMNTLGKTRRMCKSGQALRPPGRPGS